MHNGFLPCLTLACVLLASAPQADAGETPGLQHPSNAAGLSDMDIGRIVTHVVDQAKVSNTFVEASVIIHSVAMLGLGGNDIAGQLVDRRAVPSAWIHDKSMTSPFYGTVSVKATNDSTTVDFGLIPRQACEMAVEQEHLNVELGERGNHPWDVQLQSINDKPPSKESCVAKHNDLMFVSRVP